MTLAAALEVSPDFALDYAARVLPGIPLPRGAEGWFAVPSAGEYGALRFFGQFGEHERYRRVVREMLCRLGRVRAMNLGHLEEFLRRVDRLDRTRDALGDVARGQRGCILVLPAQFGRRRRGENVFDARQSCAATEFCLGAAEVAGMLLAHPRRLTGTGDLFLSCAGDALRLVRSACPCPSPIFASYVGCAILTDNACALPPEYVGIPTGFLV